MEYVYTCSSSKAMVVLLLIHFFVAPIVYEGFEIGPCFVMKYLEPSQVLKLS